MFDSQFLIALFVAFHSFFDVLDYHYDDAVPTVFCYVVYHHLKYTLRHDINPSMFLSPSTFVDLGVTPYHLYKAINYLCRKHFIIPETVKYAYPNKYIYRLNIDMIYQQRKSVPIIQELLQLDEIN